MKILYIVERFHINLYWRLKALAQAGHEVFVLANYERKCERRDPQIKHIVLRAPKNESFWKKIAQKSQVIYFDIPDLGDLKAKIKEIKPEVIVARNLNSLRTIFAFIYARGSGAQLFAEAQTSNYYFANPLKRLLIKSAVKIFKIKGLITPLKNSRPQADKIFKYLPFAIEVKDFSKEYFAGGLINILEIGKFTPRKEHLLILSVINRLKDKYPLHLTIIGERLDEKNRLEVYEYIKNNNLEKIVEVKEEFPPAETQALFRRQDLFVLPSHSEPAAFTPLEAMAAKLPVIVSDTCGTKCYLEEGKNGYIFKSRQADDLAEKIEKIIKDRNNLKTMGEASFKIAQDNHSLEAFQKGFEALLKN